MNPKDYIELKSAFTGTIDIPQDYQHDFVHPRRLQTYLDGQILARSWKTVETTFHLLDYCQSDDITLRTVHKLFDDGCWHPILCGFITFQLHSSPERLPVPPPHFQCHIKWHISFNYSISNVKKLSNLLGLFGAEVLLPYSPKMRIPKILPSATNPDAADDIPF